MLLIPKLDERSQIPQYVQLLEYIKHEIVSGRLTEHTRLPSIRALADFLSLSTTPIELAYSRLPRKGSLPVSQGRGITCSICQIRIYGWGSGKENSRYRQPQPGREPLQPAIRRNTGMTFTCRT